MKINFLFILCLLTGLLFINAGLDKFFHYMPMPKNMPEKMVKVMDAYKEIGWLLPLVSAAEILGGVLLIFKRTRPLGALVMTPLLAGILLANIYTAPSGLPLVLAIIALNVWIIVANKEKFLPIIRR